MSEKLLRFLLLNELTLVRIRCTMQGCSAGVVELPIDKVRGGQTSIVCPVCGAVFKRKQTGAGVVSAGALETLANAIATAKAEAANEHFEIEFVIPDGNGP